MSLYYPNKLVEIHTNDRFKLERMIDESSQDLVLIKTYSSQVSEIEAKKSLNREYALLKSFQNKSIVKPLRLENYENKLGLILENFEGQSLVEFLQTQTVSFPTFVAIRLRLCFAIAIQLAETLQAIHRQGIIHRNLEPGCILINPNSFELKLINCAFATTKTDSVAKTASELFSGLNIAYVAPEQTGRMNIALDYRADFYSLGILLYQIVTGVMPYDPQDSLELIHCHLAQTPPTPHELNNRISQVISAMIMKLLAKNPDDRYQSAEAIKADLEHCQTQYAHCGVIEEFELARLDRRGQFKLSTQLYARASESKAIAESIARVKSSAKAELLLLTGESGMGKTALVKQVIPTLIGKEGHFVTGNFEDISSIPYQGMIQALRELIQQLLTENPASRQLWEQKIQTAIANNGKVITNILPELELIIGSQPDIPELAPQESQNRFNTVFVKFLQVFTQAECPLILFLDNLQWADVSCLKLIELLVENYQSQYLLIIGAYREVDSDHFLVQAIAKISQITQVKQIALQPLAIADINCLLVDTLCCEPKISLPLAQLLLQRTHGNPFLIHLLLQSFEREKLLTFDFDSLSWQWSISELLTTSVVNHNILELVCNNLNQLPDTCLQILKLAACIGNRFDLTLLTHIWQKTAKFNNSSNSSTIQLDQEAIAQELNSALQEGIIIVEHLQSTASYQFSHDRVYQTVYSLLPAAELSRLHLLIGQFLLQQTSTIEMEEKIFVIVHHLNLARTLLIEQPAKNRLVKLNLTAGKKAKTANAYKVAANYLEIALNLLPRSAWQDNYPLMLAVYQQAAEIQYLLGNFIYAEQLGNILLTQAETVLDRVQVYKIKIHAHIAQNQMQLAVDLGLSVLKLLKIYLPNDFTDNPEYTLRLDISQQNIKSLKKLPIMQNCSEIRAMEILTIIIPPVYIVRSQLFPVVVAKMLDLCLQYGNSSLSAYTYGLYGMLLCASGNIETGYQLGQLALELQEQFHAQEIQSKLSFLFNNMIRHWREPAITILEHFLQGIQTGIDAGDLEHACFHAKYYCTYLFLLGEPLPTVEAQSSKQIEMIAQFKQDFQLNYARIWHQLNLNFQGKATDKFLLIGKSFDESEVIVKWQQENNATSLFALYLAKLILCYFFQDYQQAVVYGRQGKQYLNASVGTICFGEYHFYYGLAMLATYPPKTKIQPINLPADIVDCRQKIQHWASHAPNNYQHKYELISAEIARICGDNEQAATCYDRAIAEVTKVGYLHLSALAEELAGEFYLSRGKIKIAGYYLTDSYQGYLQWGALAKVQELESKHLTLLNCIPKQELITNHNHQAEEITADDYTSCSNLANLDLFSIMKASQAISSEIVLDNLLAKMMRIVMENAGAQKSTLLLEQDSAWIVAASTSIDLKTIDLPNISINEYQDLPSSIINYVQSTRSTVILKQAHQEGMFINDPYIIKHQAKSVLCCPMIYQDQLQGIIYLENSLIQGTFSDQKLSVLQALLSQVSISIANAKLYKELEDHASVQKSLKQKEILLKEIHHRVKNNLFVVSTLLDFQSNYVDDPKVIKLLENCQNRITAMAMIHQHLYGNSKLDRINFANYIESLLDNLAYSQASQERNINLILDLEPIELNIESANPCGLIVNELISNAIEHGFCDRSSGNIWLKLKHNSVSKVVMTIQDDGVGFKPGLDLYNSDSLGLELVCTLVEQLEGEIKLDQTQGTKIEIAFEELNYGSRI
ncbi:serine/threonine protein kinase [Pleurocapsa sp. CCALA 161]|uniref:AAA family ATPase n=1 Tax=Pleurocapsa sp. CCALA 161 TaxID=2107688 RepID=UPI000D07C401|nr:AAA family ATPase [Pleurocapsa sp. CCALA 161]PSB11314.1 serine/threonine protein kinase [Pleurocapsa sp. CCALA 161]